MEGKKTKKSKFEVLRQKMDIRVPMLASHCGTGLHLRIPRAIEDLYHIKAGDRVMVQMKFVRYSDLRNISDGYEEPKEET